MNFMRSRKSPGFFGFDAENVANVEAYDSSFFLGFV